MENYSDFRVLYKTADVEVVKCTRIDNNEPRCIKILNIQDIDDLNYFTQEIMNLYSLKGVKYFVEFKEFFFLGSENKVENLCIVTNFYEKGDLGKELKKREKSRIHYTDDELNKHILFLLQGFKELEVRGIYHRDIKPENFFVCDDGQIVIGDLGSCNIRVTEQKTLIGSPFYMSPEIKNLFFEFRKGNVGSRVPYDAIKSDVWSLGLTFLYMITIKSVEKFSNQGNLQNIITERLEAVPSPVYRSLLEKMIRVNPAQRSNFVELEAFFSKKLKTTNQVNPPNLRKSINPTKSNEPVSTIQILNHNSLGTVVDNFFQSPPKSSKHTPNDNPELKPEVCNYCKQSNDLISCKNCRKKIHPYCLVSSSTHCMSCNQAFNKEVYNFSCVKCCAYSVNISNIKYCNHIYCLNCQSIETECKHCFQFQILKKSGPVFLSFPDLFCTQGNHRLEQTNATYKCSLHNISICKICKSTPHYGSCISADNNGSINCNKCQYNSIKKPNSFIFYCKVCKMDMCLVCSSPLQSKSHADCAYLYSCIR